MAVAELLATTEYPQMACWIRFPTVVALFVLVPNDPESGPVYVSDHRDGVWYWVDFEDQEYSRYNLANPALTLWKCSDIMLASLHAAFSGASGARNPSSCGVRRWDDGRSYRRPPGERRYSMPAS